MRSHSYPILAAVLVIAVIGGALAACFWHQADDSEDGFSVTGTVTGLSSYNQPKLDVRADELFAKGLALGDTFRIETPDSVFDDAILIKNYNGMFMFDFFVNVESDGYVSVGFVGKLITAENGSEITLTHTGTSDRYHRTPLYNGGYTNARADYDSDEQFANFGEVSGGRIRPGTLYRSFSPLYDPATQPRSAYVNELAEKNGIRYDIALSYNDASVKAAVDSLDGYCLTLCEEGDYSAPGMGYLYFQQKEKTVAVLESILDNDGAYLIHCNVGRDRTGYAVLLLQALCGCTEDEMKATAAGAFCNLYKIDRSSEEFRVVADCSYGRNMYLIANPDRIGDMFEIDWDDADVGPVDTFQAAYSYCVDYLGMPKGDVDGLIEKLCG